MFRKLIVGLLVITVIGGIAIALVDNQNNIPSETLTQNPAHQAGVGRGNSTQSSISSVGEAWSGSGTILDLTSVGMTLGLDDGSEIFVELGSPTYWQVQIVTLHTGAKVAVDGFFNGTDYHARTVTTAEGAILALRNEEGQPLWSGGNGGQGQVQIPADQWVTLDGTVTGLTNNGMIVRTTPEQTLTISFGRADFWQTQAVSIAVDDTISMLGFWQGDQFSAGQVTKITTGERILLRDPNGRPLWAGPGRGQNLALTPEAAATTEPAQ